MLHAMCSPSSALSVVWVLPRAVPIATSLRADRVERPSTPSSRFDISGWRDRGLYPLGQGRRGARGESTASMTRGGGHFVLVLHRALPDLQRMKLCYSAAASSASRSVFSWCD